MTEEEIQQARVEHRSQIPVSCRRTYDRAITGQSLRAGVNSQCYDCMHWQGKLVRDCSNITCPLWPYRPRHGVSKANKPIMILLSVPVTPSRAKKQQSRTATFARTPSVKSIPSPDKKTAQKASCITRRVSAKKSREKPQITPQQKFEKVIKRLKDQLPPEVFSQGLDKLCSTR